MQVPRKKLVKRPNREKRAKKLKKGVAKRAGVWYYTWAPSAETKEWLPKPQLRSERKEPIDAERFCGCEATNHPSGVFEQTSGFRRKWRGLAPTSSRFVLRNRKQSKFRMFETLRKKCLTKNHFCDKIIKSSAGRLRRTGPWKLNNIEKLVTEPIFVLEKHVKQFQTK